MKQTLIPIVAVFAIFSSYLTAPSEPTNYATKIIPLATDNQVALAQEVVSSKIEHTTQSEKANGVAKVLKFLENKKHRYTETYLDQIYTACGYDDHCLFSIVAISGQESSFGTAGKANDGKGQDTNFWGFFKGGDRSYDPDQATMAKVIGEAFHPNSWTYHKRIISKDGNIDDRLARIYHGNDRHSFWVKNVRHFYQSMLN